VIAPVVALTEVVPCAAAVLTATVDGLMVPPVSVSLASTPIVTALFSSVTPLSALATGPNRYHPMTSDRDGDRSRGGDAAQCVGDGVLECVGTGVAGGWGVGDRASRGVDRGRAVAGRSADCDRGGLIVPTVSLSLLRTPMLTA